MGKVKQLSIEKELPDVGSMYPTTRIYIMNGSSITREEFISQVALSLYINEPNTDIRKTIDLLLEDDMKELVCCGGDKFFSYIDISYITNGEDKHSIQGDFDSDIVEKDMETPLRGLRRRVGIIEDPIAGIKHDLKEYIVGVDMGQEEHPLKTYKVSYDILIVPTIAHPILQRRKYYKRSGETVQATSFRQAKEMVKQKLTELGKITKSFVVELVNTEAVV